MTDTQATPETPTATITVKFKDETSRRFVDSIGYNIGGGAVIIGFLDGSSKIFNLDLIKSIDHKQND